MEGEEFLLDLLPGEVLYNIISKLGVRDRLNASLVCKKWFELSRSKPLLKDILVVINNDEALSVFESPSRNFVNFSFIKVLVDSKCYKLLKNCSSRIEYLVFEDCEVERKVPTNFDDLSYDSLKVFKMIDCELWTLFPCLPNLTELHVTGKGSMNDKEFAILRKTMKHLEVLNLMCFISYEPKVNRRFYPGEDTYDTNPSSYILTHSAVFDFISERASTLKEIRLGPEIKSSSLKELSLMKGLCLSKINLACGFSCTNGLVDLFKNQPNLKSVNLNNVMQVDDTIVEALCSLLPDIEEIYLQNSMFKGDTLDKLFQLTKLKILDISGGGIIPLTTLTEATSKFKAHQLKFLNLSRKIAKQKIVTLDFLFKHCTHLVFLDLCSNKIQDSVIPYISKHLIHLEFLCLKNSNITDFGLLGLDGEDDLPLSNLKKLKDLNLHNCKDITDNGAIEAIKFMGLEILNVSGCELKFETIEMLSQQNPSIKKIIWDEDNMKNPKIVKRRKTTDYHDVVEEKYERWMDFMNFNYENVVQELVDARE